MKAFGIFSPSLGIKADIPSLLLSEAYTPDAENIRVVNGELHRVKMRAATLSNTRVYPTWSAAVTYKTSDRVLYGGTTWVADQASTNETPADNAYWTTSTAPNQTDEVLLYHYLEQSTGTNSLFAFTEDNIYKWDSVNSVWVSWLLLGTAGAAFPPLTTATEWCAKTWGDKVLATNNQDKILVGDSASGFTWLDSNSGLEISTSTVYVTKCRWLDVFENYVVIGDETITGGDRYPYRVRWCTLGDYEDWDELGSGDTGSKDVEGADPTTGSAHYLTSLIIFKEKSYHRMSLAADDLIWTFDEVSNAYGCIAPRSAVRSKSGELLFLATDKTIRTIFGAEVSKAISQTILNIIDGAGDAIIKNVCAARIEEYSELWFAVPYGSAATGNNKVLTLSEDAKWNVRDMAVSAFGRYANATVWTYDDIDENSPWPTYDDWDWEGYDSVEHAAGFLIDICSDYSGQNFTTHSANTDDSNTYSGYFTLATDFVPQAVDVLNYKRLLNMRIYARPEASGTLDILLKRDSESGWQAVGSISLVDSTVDVVAVNLPCDFRARNFQFKISGSSAFRFLGILFEYIADGFN